MFFIKIFDKNFSFVIFHKLAKIDILYFQLFSLLELSSLSIFTFLYAINYLGNINWEVLLVAKLGKMCLPQNF